jgi:hypothetical protein
VSTPIDRRLGGAAVALAVLALVRWATLQIELSSDEPEPEIHAEREVPEPPAYTDEARRLLGDLAPGEALAAGFVVDHIEGVGADGAIRVVGVREGQRLSIWLRPQRADERPPPLSTLRFDLFYDRPQPLNPPVSSTDTEALLAVLAERVRAHE